MSELTKMLENDQRRIRRDVLVRRLAEPIAAPADARVRSLEAENAELKRTCLADRTAENS